MSNGFKALLVSALVILQVQAFAESNEIGWGRGNNPANIDENYFYNLNQLPTKGMLEGKLPWSETYWPSKRGSINLRWNQEEPEGFGYSSPSKEKVLKMSREDLARLSPSEKYDLAMGRYDYPLKKAVSGVATPRAREWSGVCHGWAPIAIQMLEPKPVDYVNPDGVVIPFGSSDVKGLLSYFAAFYAEFEPRQVGLRCENIGRVFGVQSCNDINAGALHIIMANELGIKKEGFVVEIDPRGEIWNQPAYGFEAQILASAEPARGAARAVRVKAELFYTDELDDSMWEPVVGTENFKFGKMKLDYYLDLDQNDNIIGGRWANKYSRPDFVWKPTQKAVFTGYQEGIYKIYQPVSN